VVFHKDDITSLQSALNREEGLKAATLEGTVAALDAKC